MERVRSLIKTVVFFSFPKVESTGCEIECDRRTTTKHVDDESDGIRAKIYNLYFTRKQARIANCEVVHHSGVNLTGDNPKVAIIDEDDGDDDDDDDWKKKKKKKPCE